MVVGVIFSYIAIAIVNIMINFEIINISGDIKLIAI